MTRKGVWNLQQVRDKYLQSLWVNDTSIFSWGDNGNGQSGTNTSVKISSPTQVAGDWTSASLSNGGRSDRGAVGAVKSDGTLYTWGYNNNGELGQNAQGNNARLSSPTQVGSDSTWAHVSMGGELTVATKTDGTLWSWGTNEYGSLGIPSIASPTNRSSPVQVGSDTTWDKSSKYKFSSARRNGYAIKTDGTLWSWGYNGLGNLGHNERTDRSSPTQIPGTTWKEVSADDSYAIAIKTDGTLWSWGNGLYSGVLGLNDLPRRSSPTQIPGTTWKNIFCGMHNAIATKTDGTMWAWGINDRGNLGVNDMVKRSSPTQIPGATWNIGVMAENVGMAVRTDGTLWAFGLNSNGEYGGPPLNIGGTGGPGWRSSPIQIPGTWGTDELLIADHTMFALKSDLTPSQL